MTDTSIFDPRDLRCKRPFGAAASGTPVEFTLRPLRREGWSRAVLRARFEFWENEILTAIIQRIAANPKSAALRKTSKNNPINKALRAAKRRRND